jgi:hypothetical protein
MAGTSEPDDRLSTSADRFRRANYTQFLTLRASKGLRKGVPPQLPWNNTRFPEYLAMEVKSACDTLRKPSKRFYQATQISCLTRSRLLPSILLLVAFVRLRALLYYFSKLSSFLTVTNFKGLLQLSSLLRLLFSQTPCCNSKAT